MAAAYFKEELWAELEELGEEEVRVRLVTKKYGDVGQKLVLVKEWLRRKDQSRTEESSRNSDASNRELLPRRTRRARRGRSSRSPRY